MKKGKYLLWTVLLLFGIAAAVLCIRYLPNLRTAAFLHKNLDLEKMSFDVTLTLAEERFTQEQLTFVETLSQIMGVDKEDLLVLRLQGSTWGDMVYVQITPGGKNQGQSGSEDEPLTELYLGKENDVVNAKMLYDVVLNRISGQLGALGGLLPEWSGGEYVSLAQTEQMFELDLHSAKEFEIAEYQEWFSFPTYFVMTLAADYEQIGEGTLEFSLENLPDTLQGIDNLLAKVGMGQNLAEKQGLRNIQSITGSICVETPEELRMPDSLIQQGTVEKITMLRKIIQELGVL